MKKFYSQVSVGPAVGGGYVVLLDGRPIRTPEKSLMTAPTEALADAIGAEWAAQGDMIVPETMPLSQMLTTTIDRATPQRVAITAAVMAYLDSDLLCYRADDPQTLLEEQEKLWTPRLQWFERRFGVALETTFGLARLNQPQAAHDAACAYIDGLDIQKFNVFQTVTSLTVSIVLGMAFMEGAIRAVEAWRCTLCEELHYEHVHDLEKYGLDPNEQKRRDALIRDLEAAERYLTLI